MPIGTAPRFCAGGGVGSKSYLTVAEIQHPDQAGSYQLFKIGIQHQHAALAFDLGIGHWYWTSAFDTDIRSWHLTLAFSIGIWH